MYMLAKVTFETQLQNSMLCNAWGMLGQDTAIAQDKDTERLRMCQDQHREIERERERETDRERDRVG